MAMNRVQLTRHPSVEERFKRAFQWRSSWRYTEQRISAERHC